METNFLNQLLEKEKELLLQLEAVRAAIKTFGGKPSINGNSQQSNKSPKIDVPKEYDKDLSWNSKTLYAVSKIGKGYAEDLAKYICSVDDAQDYDTAFSRITASASSLQRNKVIDAEKFGKKYKYQLKTPDF